ncbi:MAG: hypothetical protein H6Q89_4115 [Myxococcaceae bacterium]|nr:hypothetical protein [Myxococcaceae bacterium]
MPSDSITEGCLTTEKPAAPPGALRSARVIAPRVTGVLVWALSLSVSTWLLGRVGVPTFTGPKSSETGDTPRVGTTVATVWPHLQPVHNSTRKGATSRRARMCHACSRFTT